MSNMLMSKLHKQQLLPTPAACARSVQCSPAYQKQLMISRTSVQAPRRAAKVCALFNPRDIVPETLADDDEELITDPAADRLAMIDNDLLEAELDHLRSRLALEQERLEVLSQRLSDAEESLSAATARLNTRRVLDEAEDVMGAPDAGGKQFAAATADARRAERAGKWAAWAEDNPDEAENMAAEAGWDLDNLPDEVADLYEQIRRAGGRLPTAPRRKSHAASGHSTHIRRRRRHSDDGKVEALTAVDDTSSGTSSSDTSDSSPDDVVAVTDADLDAFL